MRTKAKKHSRSFYAQHDTHQTPSRVSHNEYMKERNVSPHTQLQTITATNLQQLITSKRQLLLGLETSLAVWLCFFIYQTCFLHANSGDRDGCYVVLWCGVGISSNRSVTTPLTNCLHHFRLRSSSQLPRRCFYRTRYGLTDACVTSVAGRSWTRRASTTAMASAS